MKTKKIVLTSLIFIILTGIFNMLCFVFENDRNENFIISLVFGNFSIVVYAITALLLFKRDRYKYLTLQNGFIVFGYYILCTVMNLLFVVFNLNNKTVEAYTREGSTYTYSLNKTFDPITGDGTTSGGFIYVLFRGYTARITAFSITIGEPSPKRQVYKPSRNFSAISNT